MNPISHAYVSYGSASSTNEKDAFNVILKNENSNTTCTETATRCHMARPHPENDHGMFSDTSSDVAGKEDKLTHWGRDKMAATSFTTFTYKFVWMKMHKFWLKKFHLSLFLVIQLTMF